MRFETYRYFDCAASCPPTEACREALDAFDRQPWAGANPNSLHSYGRAAFAALERARADLARSLGARRPGEMVFTGGGTESNNLALEGMARALYDKTSGHRRRVLVSALEHDSVLDCAERLGRWGIEAQRIAALPDGTVDLDDLAAKLGDDVALVSVMAANNETGVVQPLEEVVSRAHAAGALVHTDAVQAFGHVPFDAARLGVDAVSVAAHKLGGPVGVGALYLKARTPLLPLTYGGGQEGGLRPGTQDVRAACAFAAVARDAVEHLEQRAKTVRACARALVEGCCTGLGAPARPTVDAPRDERFLPGIVHLTVPGHQTEGLILALDERGFAVAGGSACSSGSLEPSHVLTAMGVPRDHAFCALRVSFDDRCTLEDCTDFAQALREVCQDAPVRRAGA